MSKFHTGKIILDEIRKKIQLKDGGEFTIFAFRDQSNKNKVVLGKKIL
jgi:hypothetical protein